MANNRSQAQIPFGPTGRPITGIVRMFSRSESDAANGPQSRLSLEHASVAAAPLPHEIEMMEDGRSHASSHNL
jgi:hypothetical protein